MEQNGWVSATGPVSNADLWIQLTSLLESSCTVFHWIKIPSHKGLRGNDVADELANKGRLVFSLYSVRSHNRHIGMAIAPRHHPDQWLSLVPCKDLVPPLQFSTLRPPGWHLCLTHQEAICFRQGALAPCAMRWIKMNHTSGGGLVALTFSDCGSLTSKTYSCSSSSSTQTLAAPRSPPSQDGTSDCTTISWAGPSDNNTTTNSLDYFDACRQLGLSPMVPPAKRRRFRSHTPSTEASSGTLDSGSLSTSSLSSMYCIP